MNNLYKFFYFQLLFAVLMTTNLFAESPDYPNTIPTSTEVLLDSTISGRIHNTSDADVIKFVVPANTYTKLSISSHFSSNNSNRFDSWGRIFDATGTYTNKYIYDVSGYTPYSESFYFNTETILYVQVYDYSSNPGTGDYKVSFASSVNPKNTREFTKVPIGAKDSLNIHGSALVIGNQLLCQNSSDGATCQEPTIGVTNGLTQHKVKIDTSTTLSSNSMARLDLKAGDEIIWAGLYWSARIASSSLEHPGADEIYMKVPSSSTYKKHTSIEDKFNWYSDGTVFDYSCMQDVTGDVKAAGAGQYFVGGIQASNGSNRYASWALLVVVENKDRKFRNITVFDGFQSVYSGTGYPDSVDVVADGFLTPKSGTVSSSLIVYSGESEAGFSDGATVTDKSGTPHDLVDPDNNINDVFNGSISTNGIHRSSYRISDPGLANPNFQNTLGVDIDKLDVDFLDNYQQETTITIRSGDDRYSLNMFAFETELYEPVLCYDYSYKQYDRYITEDSNGSRIQPRLDPKNEELVTAHEPITVKFFVRNEEESDIIVTNVRLNLKNIDEQNELHQVQAEYILNTSYQSLPNTSELLGPQTDDPATNATQVLNLYKSTIGAKEYFYVSLDLDPLIEDVNLTLDANIVYDLKIIDGGVELFSEENLSQTLGLDMELCVDPGGVYQAEPSEFNIVHDNFYNSYAKDTIGGTYNIPTQIVNRNGNFHVISTDRNISRTGNENMDLLKETTNFVGVEIIDTGGWQDVETSCTEDSSRRSSIIWVAFTNKDTNAPFNNDVINGTDSAYIFSQYTDNTDPNNIPLYSAAIEDAAFRITSFTSVNGVNPDFKRGTSQGWYLDNFIDYAGTSCVDNPSNNVSDFCEGNAGDGIANFEGCIQCILGENTKRTCSRDNFSIRPEAFLLTIQDQNQTDSTASAKLPVLDPNMTGVLVGNLAPANTIADIAAGYNYELNATAVDHDGNNPSFRYRSTFLDTTSNTGGLIYTWIPTANDANCNDTNNSDMAFSFTGNTGKGDLNTSLNQVGQYELSMIDKTWTLADQKPSHHTAAFNFATGDYVDCVEDSSATSNENSSSISGCNISSQHQSTEAGGFGYQNPRVEFHPYQFTVNSNITLGTANITPPANKPFVYMANISTSESMSVHLNTKITPRGRNSSKNLTNFVSGCYAQPLNFDIGRTFALDATNNPIDANATYKYMFHNYDSSNSTIPGDDINKTIAQGDTVTNPSFTTAEILGTFFQKDKNGTIDTVVNLNYHRDINVSKNPADINFTTISVDDNLSLFNADLVNNKIADGNSTLNQRVLHWYGKTNTPRKTIICSTSPCRTNGDPIATNNEDNTRAFIFYEVYCSGAVCNSFILPDDMDSNNDARWIVNKHNQIADGAIGIIDEEDSTKNKIIQKSRNIDTPNYKYESVLEYTGTFPYVGEMENKPDTWLIYDDTNASADSNKFIIEFRKTGGWSGQFESNTTTQTLVAPISNKRIMW